MNKGQLGWIVFLSLLSAVLRLPAAGVALHGDEEGNFSWYAFIPWRDLLFSYSDPNQHTLLVILSRLCMGLFGESEAAFRLPSLLSGIFAVPLLYRLASHFINAHAATAAACLLALSLPFINQSQLGRGYALTVFLATATMHAVMKLLDRKKTWLYGSLLPALGLSMVLALPSNLNFLLAATAFYLAACKQRGGTLGSFLKPAFFRQALPFLAMLALVGAYLLAIQGGLKTGIHIYQKYALSVGLTADWSLNGIAAVLTYLAAPWGLALYLFFGYGLAVLKREGKLLPFSLIFIVPLALYAATGMLAPGRSFIYWLPFVMTGAAAGASDLTSKLHSLWRRRSHLFNPAVPACAALALIHPGFELPGYYAERIDRYDHAVKIADARRVLAYLKSENSQNRLIVLPPIARVLNHYLFDIVTVTNASALIKGRVDEIVFIGGANARFKDFLSVGNETSNQAQFADGYLELARDIGNARIYRFPGKITKHLPHLLGPDYETQLAGGGKRTEGSLILESVAAPRLMGGRSLRIENKNSAALQVTASNTALAENPLTDGGGVNFVLLAYLVNGEPLQISLLKKTSANDMEFKDQTTYFFLNYLQGAFELKGAELIPKERFPFEWHHLHVYNVSLLENTPAWRMKLLLLPTGEGAHAFAEVFKVPPGIRFLDGIQVFLLSGGPAAAAPDFVENPTGANSAPPG